MENYRWTIASYFDGKSLINPSAAPSIAFVNGNVQGAGVCGAFGGRYSLSGATIRISAETLLADGPCFAVNLKEAEFILKALNAGERRIEQQRGGRTVLRDRSGVVWVVLQSG